MHRAQGEHFKDLKEEATLPGQGSLSFLWIRPLDANVGGGVNYRRFSGFDSHSNKTLNLMVLRSSLYFLFKIKIPRLSPQGSKS